MRVLMNNTTEVEMAGKVLRGEGGNEDDRISV